MGDLHRDLEDIQARMDTSAGISLQSVEAELQDYVRSNEDLGKTPGSLSPKKQPQRKRPEPNAAAPDFALASKLSESLLAECRKLQEQLKARDHTIAAIKDQHESAQTRARQLESRLHALQDSEERYKEETYNLEAALQELRQQHKRSADSMSRAASESQRLQQESLTKSDEIDMLQVREADLRRQLDAFKQRASADAAALKRQHDDLRADNDALNATLQELRQELAADEEMDEDSADRGLDPESEPAFDGFDVNNMPLQDVSISVAQSQPEPVLRHSDLESQTLQSSLGHAHKLLVQVKNALQKERAEKRELKRQLDLAAGPTASVKTKRSRGFGGVALSQRPSIASIRRRQGQPQASVSEYEDIQEEAQVEDQEDQEDPGNTTASEEFQSAYESAFETAPDEPSGAESDEYQTTNDTFEGGDDTETEDNGRPDAGFVSDGSLSDGTSHMSVRSRRSRASRFQRASRIMLSSPISPNVNSNILINSPSVSSLRSVGTPANLASEFLSEDELRRHAETLGYDLADRSKDEVISQDEAAQLRLTHAKVSSKDGLSAFALALGLTVIPAETHSQLVHDASRDLTPEELQAKAHAIGYTALPEAQHTQLHAPTAQRVSQLAEAHNLRTIPESQYLELTREPTPAELERRAASIGYVAVPHAQYFEVVRDAQSPDLDKVRLAAKRHGLATVAAAQFEEMNRVMDAFASPTSDYLKSKAAGLGLALVDASELEDVKRKAESPSEEEIVAHASSKGLAVVPTADLEEIKRKAEAPSEEELAAHASSKGLVAVPTAQFDDIKRKAEAPSDEELATHASSRGLVAIPTTELEEIKRKAENPSEEELATHASSRDLVAVPTVELEEIKRKAGSPTEEEIAAHASSKGLVAVPSSELEEIKRKAGSPTEEEIAAHASSKGLVAVPSSELEEIKRKAEAPSEEEIATHASSKGLVAVPTTELEEIKRKAESPSAEEIAAHASSKGLVAVPLPELEEIKRKAESPSAEEIAAHASSKGLVTVPLPELEEIKRKAESPSEEEISNHAGSKGLVAVPAPEFQRLAHPSVDDVHRLAADHGLVALAASEHTQLTNPSADAVKDAAIGHGLVAIPAAQFATIKDEATRKLTPEYIRSAAVSLGLVALAKHEVERLSKPDAAAVRDHAKTHGLVAVPEVEYSALANPSQEQVQKNAASHGLATVPEAAYRALINPSQDQVQKHAKTHGLVAVPEADYSALTNPNQDQVQKNAKTLGLVAIPETDYSALINPSQDQVEKHASSHGLVTVPEADYSALTNPSKDHIQKHAASHGLVTVPEADYTALTNPSKDQIQKHAVSHGLVTVPEADYTALINPSQEQVQTHASSHGLVAIPETDYTSLSQPSQELVQKHAKSHGLVAVPEAEYSALSNPSQDQLTALASTLGLAVISVSALQDLQQRVENVPREALNRHAAKHGLTLVSEPELAQFREFERLATEPTPTELKTLAGPGYEVVATKELKDLRSAVDDPVQLNQACERLGLVAVPQAEFDELERHSASPDSDFLRRHAKASGLAVLAASELEELRKSSSELSRAQVDTYAKKNSLVVVAKDDYASLMDRSDRLDKLAAGGQARMELASVATKREHFEDMIRQSSKSPQHSDKVAESIRSLGYVPVSQEEYRKLQEGQRDAVPTRRDVMRMARAAGLVAIDADEHRSLIRRGHLHRNSDGASVDDESVAGSPARSSFRVSSIVSVSSPVPDSVEDDSLPVNLESVPAEYLASLRRIVESPTEEDVRMLARRAGLDRDVDRIGKDVDKDVVNGENGEKEVESPTAAQQAQYQQELDRLRSENESNQAQLQSLHQQELARLRTEAESNQAQLQAQHQAELARLRTEAESKAQLEAVSPSSVRVAASKAGMVAISDSEYQQLTANQASSQNLRALAEASGFVLVSSDQNRQLQETAAMPPPAVPSATQQSLDISQISAAATNLGYAVLSNAELERLRDAQATVQRTAVLREVGETPVRHVVAAEPGQRASVLEDKDDLDLSFSFERAPPGRPAEQPRSPQVPLPELKTGESSIGAAVGAAVAGAVAATATPITAAAPYITRTPDMVNARNLSGSSATINTMDSAYDRNMIPYITQVVIGEYLFKYTRKVAISAISDNRHERYFWIHPYSLTLYWSSENPAVENRKPPKTKSAPIVGVKTVEDRNPLPPGLYHKSIIVESVNRQIKITCPTRERHNIWYSSMMFLLKRSADDLNLDEDENDDYSHDTHFERERARTAGPDGASVAGSVSGTQRVLSFRRSLAPEMNMNTVRSSRQSASSLGPSDGRHSSLSMTRTGSRASRR